MRYVVTDVRRLGRRLVSARCVDGRGDAVLVIVPYRASADVHDSDDVRVTLTAWLNRHERPRPITNQGVTNG